MGKAGWVEREQRERDPINQQIKEMLWLRVKSQGLSDFIKSDMQRRKKNQRKK
jgi:hypothetical protein